MDARRAMRTDALRSATERAEDLWTGLDPAGPSAIITVALAEQDFTQTTLRKEVLTARDALRDAVERGDQTAQGHSSFPSAASPNKAEASSRTYAPPSTTASVLPSRR